jgi:hypothetical protein
MRAVGRILWLPFAFLLAAIVAIYVVISLGQERIVQAATGRGPDEVTLNAGFELLRLGYAFVSINTLLPALLLVAQRVTAGDALKNTIEHPGQAPLS